MKKHILPAVILAALPISAFAQTATSATQSNALSNARTGSSTAILAPSSNNYAYQQPAIAPDISAITANACALASGITGAGGGILALGYTRDTVEQACQNEATAGAWHALGQNLMAVGTLCEDNKQAALYLAVYGTPCPGQPGWKPVASPDVARPVPVISARAAFCSTLDMRKPEDRPYAVDCMK
jgi:hypothetical protein